MHKLSPLSKWTLNIKHSEKAYKRRWLHSPDTLKNGHVIYVVKYLGKTEASQPKGIESVKECIQRLTFNNEHKASKGIKVPKVELSISIDGVAILNIKNKVTMYRYPLHQISYCADDKSDRKLFCFIAKEPDSMEHNSFVFASEKLAEEITMTIGQAFDLAYRHFLETSGREAEIQQNMEDLKRKVQELEAENKRLVEDKKKMERIHGRNGVSGSTNNLIDICFPPLDPPPSKQNGKSHKNLNLLEFNEKPALEKRHTYLEDIKDLGNNFNGNGTLATEPLDQFGMKKFHVVSHSQNLEFKPRAETENLLEIMDGFKRGMSFGNDDFSTKVLNIGSK